MATGSETPGLSTGGLIFEQQQKPELVSPDTQIYQLYISDLESRLGAYAPRLSEQLLGLGIAYQEQGLHSEAAKVLKRAVHLIRVNNGLYSEDQIPILQRLISALVANGDYQKADEKQYYLFRVQRELYEANAPQMAIAMLERAKWEKQAYLLSVGDTAYARLLTMWELYRRVLGNITEREGSNSPQLLHPLNGLLQTQYLISTYDGESKSGVEFSSSGSNKQGAPKQNRFALVQASNYRQGQAVISAMHDVRAHNEPKTSLLPAETKLDLGDWHMWYRKRNAATQVYQQVWDEMAGREDAPATLQHYFGEPVMLPTRPGYHEDIAPPTNITGFVEVSFVINERGRMEDLETLSTEIVNQAAVEPDPSRLLRRLRNKIWRPRIENREPTATDNKVKRYAF